MLMFPLLELLELFLCFFDVTGTVEHPRLGRAGRHGSGERDTAGSDRCRHHGVDAHLLLQLMYVPLSFIVLIGVVVAVIGVVVVVVAVVIVPATDALPASIVLVFCFGRSLSASPTDPRRYRRSICSQGSSACFPFCPEEKDGWRNLLKL